MNDRPLLRGLPTLRSAADRIEQPPAGSADRLAQLRAADGAVDRSRQRYAAAIAEGGLDQPTALHDDDGHHVSLRRMLSDLVEEYGRRTGHADLLREAVDGLVGEDSPAGWRP